MSGEIYRPLAVVSASRGQQRHASEDVRWVSVRRCYSGCFTASVFGNFLFTKKTLIQAKYQARPNRVQVVINAVGPTARLVVHRPIELAARTGELCPFPFQRISTSVGEGLLNAR